MTTLSLLLASLCFISFPLAAAEAADAAQPNIVLILADDLGYGDVRCYNEQSKVPTPHIDRLAREGMRFTDAHSPCTVCTPTRYSLMTGQMAFRVPNGGTVFTGVGGPSLIAPGRLTLPSMLRDNGELQPFALPDTAPEAPAQLYNLKTDPRNHEPLLQAPRDREGTQDAARTEHER